MTEGIKAQLTGTVTRTFGIGFQVEVPSGKYPQKVSVFTTHQPVIGATVTVAGTLTMSKDKDWVDREGVRHPGGYSLKVNDSVVTEAIPGTPAQPAPVAQDDWTGSNEEMPF